MLLTFHLTMVAFSYLQITAGALQRCALYFMHTIMDRLKFVYEMTGDDFRSIYLREGTLAVDNSWV